VSKRYEAKVMTTAEQSICRLQTGTAVRLLGRWQACPPGKQQLCELHVDEADIIGEGNAEVTLFLALRYTACLI
jgi:hypothetical protein